jgi:hypothetical protein
VLTPLQRTWRYCRGDGSLTLAVAFLIAFIFVLYPMVEVGVVQRIWLDLAFACAIAFAATFVFEPRPQVKAFLVLLGCALVARIIDHYLPGPGIFVVQTVLVILACGFLGELLLARVFRDGRINLNRIMGAIGAYLLLGIVFAQAYRLLTRFVPGAFAMQGAPVEYAAIADKLQYYSFITLTSTGYGDITPLHPYARSLATLEALAGGLFMTVLVARLVAQEVEWRYSERTAIKPEE